MSSASRLDENKESEKEVEIPTKEVPKQLDKTKFFLKKHRLTLLILLAIIGSYVGLQMAKNNLKQETGEQTEFKSGEAPDLASENKAKEEAQTKTDRMGEADKANNQASETNQMEKDTNQLVRFSMLDVYKKTLSSEVKKVEIQKPDTIKQVEAQVIIATKPKQKQQTLIANSRREKIKYKIVSSEIITEKDGFNTVIVDSKKNIENTSYKVNSLQKHYFKAAIYGNQTVGSGSQVRIRLLESLVIDGQTIPTNSLCTGIAMLGSNRVSIALTSVQVHGQQIGIKSIVFDKDLLPGIAFMNETEVQQNIRQQRNAGIDQTSNDAINAIPQIGGVAGAALSTSVGVVNGISKSIRYGGVQKHIGEITLEEGYKVFIQQ
nr:conjugative transposon protein TraM [uncultured Emticicia sp.]